MNEQLAGYILGYCIGTLLCWCVFLVYLACISDTINRESNDFHIRGAHILKWTSLCTLIWPISLVPLTMLFMGCLLFKMISQSIEVLSAIFGKGEDR